VTYVYVPTLILNLFFMGRIHYNGLLLRPSSVARALHYTPRLAHPNQIAMKILLGLIVEGSIWLSSGRYLSSTVLKPRS